MVTRYLKGRKIGKTSTKSVAQQIEEAKGRRAAEAEARTKYYRELLQKSKQTRR
jgi:hypothetical protein